MKSGQILITDVGYNIYINTIHKEFLIDIIHTELSKENNFPEVMSVNIVQELVKDNYKSGSTTISPNYNFNCDLFITVDFSTRVVTIDGSSTDDQGFVTNYEKVKYDFDDFVKYFYTRAKL